MILTDILEEHLEEADLLFHQREAALNDRAYALSDLAELDERLLAHLDGLLLAGNVGWELLQAKLVAGEVGEVFAAAFVALESGDAARLESLRKVLDEGSADVLNGIRHALRHANTREAEELARPLLSSPSAPARAVALDVLSFRRMPIEAHVLQRLLIDQDASVVMAAVAASGRLCVAKLKDDIERLLGAESSVLRAEAMKAGLLVGSRIALDAARNAVLKRADEADDALVLIGLAGHPEDLPLLVDAMKDPSLSRNAVTAIGSLGRVAGIEPLIRCAADEKVARLAGAAIATICGADLVQETLVADQPSAPPAKAETGEDDDDDQVDPDEDLPAPDPERLTAWWRKRASGFDQKIRYRNRQPYGQQVLREILQAGTLPERHHAALELALIDPRSLLIETSALARQQAVDVKAVTN